MTEVDKEPMNLQPKESDTSVFKNQDTKYKNLSVPLGRHQTVNMTQQKELLSIQ